MTQTNWSMKQKQPHRHRGHLDSQARERIGRGIKWEFRVISCKLVSRHTTLLKFSACTGIQRQEEDLGLTQTDRRTQSQGLINCRLSFLEGRFLRQVVCLNNGSLSGYIFPLLNGGQLLQLQVWWTVGEQMLNQMGKQHTKSQNPLGKGCRNLWCFSDVGICTPVSPWFSTR